MKDIEGFHILWTAPYFEKSKDDTYSMQDYELLTMILSALMWRKMNGPITLYGDARAIDYVEGQGLSHIWNGGIKEIQVPDSISPGVFWAAGKLYALKGAHMRAVMVDLDRMYIPAGTSSIWTVRTALIPCGAGMFRR